MTLTFSWNIHQNALCPHICIQNLCSDYVNSMCGKLVIYILVKSGTRFNSERKHDDYRIVLRNCVHVRWFILNRQWYCLINVYHLFLNKLHLYIFLWLSKPIRDQHIENLYVSSQRTCSKHFIVVLKLVGVIRYILQHATFTSCQK